MSARRILAAGIALAIAGALLVAPSASGASAAAAPDSPVTVPLEGLLRVVPVEAGPEQVELDAVDASPEPAPAPSAAVEITLVTEGGTAVELALDGAGPQWADAASGSRFAGAVAVPEEISAAVADEVAADETVEDAADEGAADETDEVEATTTDESEADASDEETK